MTALEFIALDEATPQLRAPGAGDTYTAPRFAGFPAGLGVPNAGELTIASGVITVTGSYHTVDTEADAPTDDLLTINGGTDGMVLVIQAAHTDRTVVVKDGVGNILLPGGDYSLDDTEKSLSLIYDPDQSKWIELARSYPTANVSDGDKGDITVSSSGSVWTIDNGVVTLAKMANLATDRLIGRDTAGTGVPEALTVGGGIEFTGSAGIQTSAFTGDVTKAAGGTALTIADDAVTDAKLRESAALSVIGRSANSTGNPADIAAGSDGDVLRRSGTALGFGQIATAGITDAAVTLAKMADLATDRLIGRDTAGTGVPEPLTVGGGVEFTGSGGIQTSAFTGDVTKSAGGTAQTIANDAVTYAKMQNISATSRILGRKTAGAGDTEECTLSEVLDFIGAAAQGDILYRGASAWARLGAGTSGHFLQTQGAGANPQWAASSASPGGSSGQVQYNNSSAFGGANIFVGTNVYDFRNSTTAQNAYIYNTYTSGSVYERLNIGWNSNEAMLEVQQLGASNRGMTIRAISTLTLDTTLSGIMFKIGGVNKWQVDSGGVLSPFSDNALDFGATGNRIRRMFVGEYILQTRTTVASLGAATAGKRWMVSDALTPVYGATVTGGGAVTAPVFADGTNWIVG